MNYHSPHYSCDVIKTLSTPEIVRVSQDLFAAKFDLMKFTPAKLILETALSSGALKPGGHVIESSSGTFALALAILCSLHGLKLTLVTGPISDIVRWRLENLGANLHTVPASENCEGGIQQARLNVLASLLENEPEAFWPQQYTNPLNAKSYETIARRFINELPRIDAIVGPVGSGGSLFGMSKIMQQANPELKVIAVDHNRSVIFGAHPNQITRMCRESFEQLLAMGAGIPMGNVEYERCDAVHWVPVPLMINSVHRFHKKTGYLVGPSSGASLTVANWLTESNPGMKTLAILPDHGVRYSETVFNPEWLSNWKQELDRDWTSPTVCDSPLEITEDWCLFPWHKASFKEVIGHEPRPRPSGFNP